MAAPENPVSGPSSSGSTVARRNPYQDQVVISWPELHRDARYLCRTLHDLGD